MKHFHYFILGLLGAVVFSQKMAVDTLGYNEAFNNAAGLWMMAMILVFGLFAVVYRKTLRWWWLVIVPVGGSILFTITAGLDFLSTLRLTATLLPTTTLIVGLIVAPLWRRLDNILLKDAVCKHCLSPRDFSKMFCRSCGRSD